MQELVRTLTLDVAARRFVQFEHVEKVYRSKRGDVAALQDIDTYIGQAEFLSVLGPSGCGKSTLLRCLAGLEQPTGGRILLAGQPIDGPPDALGVVFQRDILLDWRTVIDNVLFPIEIRRQRKEQWVERARELLAMIGLAGYEHRHPWELSGGQRQRVAICRALIQEPQLLLMDEPFGALDALTRDELNLELQRLWMSTKKTVLFITHSISEAVLLSDRVVVMAAAPGRILETIAIDLPRSRSLDTRETPEFGRYAKHIRGLFQNLGLLRGAP
jgi:NitT/TauT family transport system ATP-binding protein